MKFDLPVEAVEHREAVVRQIIEAGVPEARGRALLDDYYQEQAMASYRLVRRLDLASRACEAVTRDRRRRATWCDQPAATTRDGHRACRRHAHGIVAWQPPPERRAEGSQTSAYADS